MAAVANLSIDQGATFSSDVTIKGFDGNVFNLTGYTARAKLAKGYSSTRTRTNITCTIANDATSGVITLSLTDAQTAALDAERYVYDLEIVSGNGVVTRALEGIITVRPEVTTA
jgi:hypothetical protein